MYAKKEVILAAGSIFMPHLLMLSGIGPKDVLSAAKIGVKNHLPAVGSNFQDHPALYMTFSLSNQTVPNLDMLLGPTPDAAYDAQVAAEYYANRSGPYTTTRGNALLFLPLKYFSTKYKHLASFIASQNAIAYLPAPYAQHSALLRGFLK